MENKVKEMKFLITILFFISISFGCEIHTSPPNLNTMILAPQDGWYYNEINIFQKNLTKISFAEAFLQNDKAVKNYIKDVLCKKLNWQGVVNYNLKWQITDNSYFFTVSFDAFKYK